MRSYAGHVRKICSGLYQELMTDEYSLRPDDIHAGIFEELICRADRSVGIILNRKNSVIDHAAFHCLDYSGEGLEEHRHRFCEHTVRGLLRIGSFYTLAGNSSLIGKRLRTVEQFHVDSCNSYNIAHFFHSFHFRIITGPYHCFIDQTQRHSRRAQFCVLL